MVNTNQVLELIQTVGSYSEVGRILGVSRERIRQIAGGMLDFDNYESVKEASRRLPYSETSIRRYVQLGWLPGKLLAGKWRIIKASKPSFGSCIICGSPLEKRRRAYCGDKCAHVGHVKSVYRSLWRRLRQKKGTTNNIESLQLRQPAKTFRKPSLSP